MKKQYILAFFALFLAFGFGITAKANAAENTTLVPVTSCEQVGNDIRISINNGSKTILTSTCRDTGHGMRQYKLSCTSKTQYKVEWSTPSSCTAQDKVHPRVSITAPKTVVSNNEVVALTATAFDVKGVTKIEIYEGKSIVKTCLNSTICIHSFTATAQQNNERPQTFKARAYDAAGNVGISSALVIRTRALNDTIKPEVRIGVNKTTVQSGGEVILTATSTDLGGVATIEIFKGREKLQICTGVTTCRITTSLSVLSGFTTNTYSFYAKSTDRAGNVQYSDHVEVTATTSNTQSSVVISRTNYTQNGSNWIRLTTAAVDPDGVSRIRLYAGKGGNYFLGTSCFYDSKPKTATCDIEYPKDVIAQYFPLSVYATVTDGKGNLYTSAVTQYSN